MGPGSNPFVAQFCLKCWDMLQKGRLHPLIPSPRVSYSVGLCGYGNLCSVYNRLPVQGLTMKPCGDMEQVGNVSGNHSCSLVLTLSLTLGKADRLVPSLGLCLLIINTK